MASASNELRIVLVGKTGNGKSATGNSLLSGRARFKASGGAASSTTKCEFERNEISDVNGKIVKLLVVDTPGFFDKNPSNTNEIVKKKITSEIFNLTSPGVHAFLIILSGNGRFSPEEKDTVDLIEQIFGSGVAQYCIVVFTCLDKLRDSEDYTDLDDHVSKGPDALKELVRKCGSRKFAIDNKSRENGLMKQVKELVKMIDNMVRANGGKCYTNDVYKSIEEEREKKRKEEDEKKRKEQEARDNALKEQGRSEERERAASNRFQDDDRFERMLDRMSSMGMYSMPPPLTIGIPVPVPMTSSSAPVPRRTGGRPTGEYYVSNRAANGREIFVSDGGHRYIFNPGGTKRYLPK